MYTPVFPDKKIQYGEGVFLNNHFDTPMMGHSGSVPTGYSTQLSIYPEQGIISVVLMNNRKVLHPVVYVDANAKYMDSCLVEQIFQKKIGLIKKSMYRLIMVITRELLETIQSLWVIYI